MYDRPLRAMPADFAAMAPTLTMNTARIFWATSRDAVSRWEKESGVSLMPGCDARKAPRDWETFVKDKTRTQVMEALKITKTTYQRFVRQTGFKAGIVLIHRKNVGLEPPPASFFEDAKHMTIYSLRAKYGIGEPRIARLLRDADIVVKPSKPIRAAAHRAPQAAPMSLRDDSIAGRAAAFLARERACFPEKTAHDRKTGAWWWGNMRFATADEMVERAKRKGFRVGGEMVG